ncbi:MAG: hypothetical protein AB8U25_02840 [Rickettsiales endosymbiont of Dermacentor nuttalli]
MLPWSIHQPMALIFDEYDAARPELMFVLQRILENDGKFTLIDQNQVITPNPYFRTFATTNTYRAWIRQGYIMGYMLSIRGK